ncbi:hypothetical protein HOP61_21365 [Halomonas daqingensis]|uniref:Uncharacterized protein n=1 Tax=Billgrantia desiderata TaxID=52021 RepID=A0AAW4Z0L4_9GAMM|nr:hypothetical protein [Halomonas desiderata]MCE8053847.1 hypothetical protein [Halomonas desiderata]
MKISSIGVAAHIHAASLGGPRYDPAMTPAERSSISNAIWLCGNCSIFIDRDEARYPATLLREWKRVAEEAATREKGKRLPAEEDAVHQTTMALTGFPQKFIPHAISNVHKATAIALGKADPRFEVVTHYRDGNTIFEYQAKKDVNFSMTFSSKESKELIKRFIEHGEDVEIPSTGLETKGFTFAKDIPEEKSVVKLIRDGKAGIQKIWLIEPETNVIEQFDDVHGKVVLGTKALRFEGTACLGLFSLTYAQPLERGTFDGSFNFTLLYEKWANKPLKALPYVAKLSSFFEKYISGWVLHTALEVYGNRIFETKTVDPNNDDALEEMSLHLKYVKHCSLIAKTMKSDVCYRVAHRYSYEDERHVHEVANILEGNAVYTVEDGRTNPTFSLEIEDDGEGLKQLISTEKPVEVTFVESGEVVKMFGEEIEMPDKVVNIKSVFVKATVNLDVAKKGDKVEFECFPAEGYELSIRYKETQEN